MVLEKVHKIDMADTSHHIRLVAGIELRPPDPGARFEFTRDESERLGTLAAEDLARVVADVTAGHLVTGAAMLEPGQVVNPETAPWKAMARLADLNDGLDPGITSLGVHRGQPPSETLVPYRSPPQGLFLCLPLLLAMTPARADDARSKLESTLFEAGGLHPPFMATLAETSGLEPVHGQLMTIADLMALLKVQLAGAGLDPFWPPVEHAILAPDEPARLSLPARLAAEWNAEARGCEFAFAALDESGTDPEQWLLWLRALRQTTTLLESFLVRWRVTASSENTAIDADSRWVERRLGPDRGSHACLVEHDSVGLVGYSAAIGGERFAFYPLDPDAIEDLESELRQRGVEAFDRSAELDLLLPA